jgi:UDP-3-O-[3-hydroxymyristoyl] glucosamine N-acyltransferase
VAQVGVAGSTIIGHHCTIGGQVGIVGHINIGNNVTIAAQSGVTNNIPDGKVMLGSPAMEASHAKRIYGTIQHLPEMRQTIRNLQNQIEQITSPAKSDSPQGVPRTEKTPEQNRDS